MVIIINYCHYSQGKVVIIIIDYCLSSQGKVVIIIIDYCLSSQGKVVDHQEEAELKLVNELLSKAQRTRVKLLSKVYIYIFFLFSFFKLFFGGGGGVRDPFTDLHWKVGGWVAGGGGGGVLHKKSYTFLKKILLWVCFGLKRKYTSLVKF